MKQLITLSIFVITFTSCKNETRENEDYDSQVTEASKNVDQERNVEEITIEPVSHATAIIKWGDVIIYNDPTGGAAAFEGKEEPDFVLISDIHGDHMNAETLKALELGETQIIVPKAVKDQLPAELQENLVVLNNGESREFRGFDIEAVPMYNLPEDEESRHPKGRGNGYILEKDGQRLYIAGDTEGIDEMRNLQDIDMALIPMNLPYTMDVEQAADAVLAFKPKQVYPYHYRGQDGLADVEKFKELVNAGNEEIEVVLLEWYPNQSN
ncbi:MBL fold metallo-hydrolase [Antarcticibacterium flavum]|uniref:MBL fold metallo-hydrolase n=1 Tax=Antarcticibacterium flavum TaxID=2058175 RepID=A0A5B7X7Z4_9FLAO|nr:MULTISPECIES: MBL fold metallo-hydrolase [Antarcticibacterium]MCM4159622.1 MBL fold metallo-hydrolase [Antarcticibacterium sp. W02-3]QCY70868.1 MBL fold metallo-hydrolase [Antarcticibacterium flavum]